MTKHFRFIFLAYQKIRALSARFASCYPFWPAFVCDIAWSSFTLPCAFFLKGDITLRHLPQEPIAAFTFIAAGALIMTGASKGVQRYVSSSDLWCFLKTALLTEAFFLPYLFFSQHMTTISGKMLVIQFLCLVSGWMAMRLFVRAAFLKARGKAVSSSLSQKALILGLGPQAELFLRQTLKNSSPTYQIIGFIDSKQNHANRYIHGVPVLGTLDRLEDIVRALQKKTQTPEVLLISPSCLSSKDLALLVKKARPLKLHLSQLPTTSMGQPHSAKIQPANLSTLLQRPRRETNVEKVLEVIKNKRVLVTGAGGSLGRECAMQIADLSPGHVTLLDHNAHRLNQTSQALHTKHPRLSHKAFLCNIRQKNCIFDTIASEKPDYIFHGASLKQTALVENQPAEGILTNLVGTRYLADAAKMHHVKAMLFLSTRHAQAPKSLLDLTRYLAETYCQFLDTESEETKFATVRLGSLLGSSRSIVSQFQKQINARKPITLLHPDVVRYFLTTAEAAQLIIHSLFLKMQTLLPQGGTFVLDQGEKISLLEMAETLIELSHLEPYEDIPITFMGLNTNNALQTSNLPLQTKLRQTAHPHISILMPEKKRFGTFMDDINKLEQLAFKNDHDACASVLKKFSPPDTDFLTPGAQSTLEGGH